MDKVHPTGLSSGFVSVMGASLRWYLHIGKEPTVVLLHGGGANSSWWFESVKHFGDRQVLLLDYSGHGDSSWRATYSLHTWAREIKGAIRHLVKGEVSLVCHSMSGRIGVLVAADRKVRLRSLVLVDTVIPTHEHEPVPSSHPVRYYRKFRTALDRFRFIPPDFGISTKTRETIAKHSLRKTTTGWTWKFDPYVFQMPDTNAVNSSIASISCPVGLVVAEFSTVSNVSMSLQIERMIGSPVETRLIEGVGHHLMLEKPAEVAKAILGLLATIEAH